MPLSNWPPPSRSPRPCAGPPIFIRRRPTRSVPLSSAPDGARPGSSGGADDGAGVGTNQGVDNNEVEVDGAVGLVIPTACPGDPGKGDRRSPVEMRTLPEAPGGLPSGAPHPSGSALGVGPI